MKKLYLFILALLTFVGLSSLNAQTLLFSEDFAGGGIPASWTNTGTPATDVWEYTTVGGNWGGQLASTTAANGYVMFDSDGYGGGAANADLITESFSTLGETNVNLQFQEFFRVYNVSSGTVSVSNDDGATWTDVYTVNADTDNPNLVDIDISAEAANSANVKVKFNYVGDYEYWWLIDDIFVYAPADFDVAIDSAYVSEYTAVPFEQSGTYTPAVGVVNLGVNAATNVSVDLSIYDGTNTSVFTSTMTQANLAAGASADLVSATSFTPSGVDFYLAEFVVSITEADAVVSNDTFVTAIDVTDSLYARDFAYLVGAQNAVTQFLGIGAGQSIVMGNVFDVTSATDLVSIEAFINATVTIGDTVNARLYSFAANTVGAEIAMQEKIITAADTPVILMEFIFNEPLAPGQYYMAIEETNSIDNIALWFSDDIYTPNRSKGSIDGGAFSDFIDLGFKNVPLIRANLHTSSLTVQDCEDLIISEVLEGSGNSKCLEIYNPTASSIDLSAYDISIYSNGAITPNSTTTLAGTVAPNSTFVICNSGSSAALLALADATNLNNTVNFNGNDVIELLNGSTTIDIVGEIGNSADFNKDQTLVRNEDVLKGDTDGLDAFDASVWTSLPQDDASDLGAHYSDCNPVCRIDSVVAGTQTACDVTTNEYTQEVTVYFSTAPTTGMLSVAGQTFAIGTSPQTVSLTGLDSDGNDVDVNAVFTDDVSCTFTETALFTAPTACVCPTITVSVTTTDVTNCSAPDGTATATVTTGTAPYTYLWDDANAQATATASNLSAGTYEVTVTDANGCTGAASESLANTSGVSATVTVNSNASCNGLSNGAATVNATGGTTYTYVWSDGGAATATRTDLGEGAQSVEVTDENGCSFTAPFTITEPTALSLTGSSVNITCNAAADGTASINVTGGTTSYTYLWNDANAQTTATANNLSAGIYSVEVTDANGCTETSVDYTITEPAVLEVTVDSSSDVTCFAAGDGEISTTVSGGTTPYTNVWTNSTETTEDLTGLDANDYTLSVTDANGCSASGTQVTIVEPTELTATGSTTAESTSGAADGTATAVAVGGTSPYTYVWNDASAQTTATASDLAAGNYTVSILDANGCSTSVDVEVDLANGIKQINLVDFNIYPNPAVENVTISFDLNSSQNMDVKFYNTIGKVILSETVYINNSFNKTFDVSDFSVGIYFIEISNENGKAIKKLTVNK